MRVYPVNTSSPLAPVSPTRWGFFFIMNQYQLNGIDVEGIQKALFNKLQHHVYCPNLYLFDFESDFISVQKSLYVNEFEIKLSRTDFRADAKKSVYSKRIRSRWNKYEMLLQGKGANRFYYVFPKGMMAGDEVPEWAGYYEADIYCGSVFVVLKRKAKLLHHNKINFESLLAISRSLSFKTMMPRTR